MSNLIPDLTPTEGEACSSGRGALLFVLHPLTNEIWAGDNAKLAVLAVHQITQRDAIQFLKMSQAKQRPQSAFTRGLDQLIEIRQMSVEQLSGDSNRDMGGIIASIHDFPRRHYWSCRGLLPMDARENGSCENSGKRSVNFRNPRVFGTVNASVGKNKVRHRELTAHARARYRCFLPDLAGLARVRRVRPMPDLNHSSIPV